jgi:hypothetical protein
LTRINAEQNQERELFLTRINADKSGSRRSKSEKLFAAGQNGCRCSIRVDPRKSASDAFRSIRVDPRKSASDAFRSIRVDPRKSASDAFFRSVRVDPRKSASDAFLPLPGSVCATARIADFRIALAPA